jgi:hypothetical protein
MRESGSVVPGQVRRYFAAAAWLLRDGLQGSLRTVLMIGTSHVVGVGAAACSLGLLFQFARRAEQGNPLQLGTLTLPTDNALGALIVSGMALFAGLLSALCLYTAELAVHGLARRYQRRCIRRVGAVAGRPDVGRVTMAVSARTGQPVSLAGLAQSTSRFCAYALRSLLRTGVPTMYTVLAVSYLIYLNWQTTAVLLACVVFYLVPLIVINRRVAEQHRTYRRTSREVMSTLRRGLRSLESTSGPVCDEALWAPAVLDNPEFDRMQDALYGRLLAGKKVELLNGSFIALSLFAIFVAAVLAAGGTGISWATLLVYLVALRIAWTGIRGVTGSLITVNRFFHEFELFGTFLDVSQAMDERSAAPPELEPDGIELPPTSSSAPIRLAPGTVTLLLDGRAVDRQGLELAVDTLLASVPPAERPLTRFFDAPQTLPGVSLLAQAVGPEATQEEVDALRSHLSRLRVMEEIDAMPDALGTTMVPTGVLSPDASFAITSAPALNGAPSLVVQSLRGWRGLSAGFQRRFLRAMHRQALLLIDDTTETVLQNRYSCLLKEAIDQVLIQDGEDRERLDVGDSEWLTTNQEEIESRLSRQRPSAATAGLDQDLVEAEEALDDL